MQNMFLLAPVIMRIHAPTGYLLSFFPAVFGLLLAYKSSADLKYIPIFLLGSILARGVGCIINDIFDQKLDQKVSRTKNRPLASGQMSTKQALIILIITLLLCLSILLSLNITAIIIGFIAALFILIYPLMKRITYFPQIFLGITFNMGCLIGYGAVANTITKEAVILYLSCAFWTVAYDAIYAFMDLKDDKRAGIKSIAIFLENKNYKMIILALYCCFFTLLSLAFGEFFSILSMGAIFISLAIVLWAVTSLNIVSPENCMVRFKVNNYIGFILFFSILLEKL